MPRIGTVPCAVSTQPTRSRRIDEASNLTNRCARWMRPIPGSARWQTTPIFWRACRTWTRASVFRASPGRRLRQRPRRPPCDRQPHSQRQRLVSRPPLSRQRACRRPQRLQDFHQSSASRASVPCSICSRQPRRSRLASGTLRSRLLRQTCRRQVARLCQPGTAIS